MDPAARIIDVGYGGKQRAVGAWLVGDTLIDCGSQACVPTLLEGLGDDRPARLLLTHIHFDHAGAAGELVRRWPDLEVWVHPVGAPHLVDPTRLVDSARRVFGEQFETLVGDVVPVPQENIHLIEDGAQLGDFATAWTPGPRAPPRGFLDRRSGVCYPGRRRRRRARARRRDPPDAAAGHRSRRVARRRSSGSRAWSPTAFHLPHFGAVEDAAGAPRLIAAALDRHEAWAHFGFDALRTRTAAWLGERIRAGGRGGLLVRRPRGPSAEGIVRWLERSRQAEGGSARAPAT